MKLRILQLKQIILFSLFLFLPLPIVRTLYNPYEFPKYIFLIICVELLLLISIVEVFLSRKIPKLDVLSILVLLYGGWNIITTVLGVKVFNSVLGSPFRHQGLIFLLSCILIYFVVRSLKTTTPYIYAIQLSVVFVLIFSLWQLFQIHYLHESVLTYQGRIVATLGNPNSLAGYILMTLPFFFLTFKKKKLSLVSTAAILLLGSFAIYQTNSRSGLIGLSVLFAMVVLYRISKLKIKPIFKWMVVGVLILTSCIGIYVSFYKNSKTQDTIVHREAHCPAPFEKKNNEYPWYFRLYYKNTYLYQRDSFCDNRFRIWTLGFNAFIQKPLSGYGMSNYEYVVPKNEQIVLDSAHNIFLEEAVASGIVGFFLLSIIFGYAFIKARFIYKLVLVAFFICGFLNPLSIPQVVLFWFVVAQIGKKV